MFNYFSNRLDNVESSLTGQGVGEIFCDCSNAKDQLYELLKMDPPGCQSEVHNPRPESLIRPVIDRDSLMIKLLGRERWENMPAQEVNIALEFDEPEPAEINPAILEDPEPGPKLSGDPISDKIAARLLKKPVLDREGLAKKLLVPTEPGEGINST